MKTYESQILNIQDQITDLTNQIFKELCGKISSVSEKILSTSNAISKIDTLSTLAQVAIENRYIKPTLTNKTILEIKDGRHPVVEQISIDKMFIPNDLILSKSGFLGPSSQETVSPLNSIAALAFNALYLFIRSINIYGRNVRNRFNNQSRY